MKRAGPIAFLVLSVAVIAALIGAQRLRHSEPVVLGIKRTVAFSPVGSGARSAVLSFYLKRSDTVAVSVVDSRGDQVRSITAARDVSARSRVRFVWFGTGSNGKRAPDGDYRFRVGLAKQGRSVIVPFSVRLDTVPADAHVEAITPDHGAGPFLLPAKVKPTGLISGPFGRDVVGVVIRTDVFPARIVQRVALPHRARTFPWNGLIAARPAPDGIYMLGVTETDQAGNRGSSPRRLVPSPNPIIGRPGVTVRHLGVEPPPLPARPGSVVKVGVDSRGRSYQWALRTYTNPTPLAKGKGSSTRLAIKVPAKASGLLNLAVVTGRWRVEVPLAVNARPARTLVVLPAIRWQGLSPVDQNGDGVADLLSRGNAISLNRLMPPIKGGPAGLRSDVLPLLARLGSQKIPVETTTDIALATGQGPALKSFHGLILAGEETWLPARMLASVRLWTKAGGHLLNLGTGSLLRTIVINGVTASRPSKAASTDAVGAVIGRPAVQPASLLVWMDKIGLFSLTGGQLDAPIGWSQTDRVAAPGKLVAAAGPEASKSAVAAWSLGRGLVIRPGLPTLARSAIGDPNAAGLLDRALRLTAGG